MKVKTAKSLTNKKKKEEEGGILNIENEASSTKNTVIIEVQYLVLITVYQQLIQYC